MAAGGVEQNMTCNALVPAEHGPAGTGTAESSSSPPHHLLEILFWFVLQA